MPAALAALGGLLMVALGAYVARVGRTEAHRAFAAYAVLYGASGLLRGGLAILEMPPAWGQWASGVCLALAGLALVPVGLWFPERLARSERRALVVASASGLFFLLMGGLGVVSAASARPAAATTEAIGGVTLFSATLFVVVLLTLRYRHAETHRSRVQRALVAAGIGLGVAVPAGGFLLRLGDVAYGGLLAAAFFAAIVVAWLAHSRGEDGHVARNVALVLPAAMLVGMLFQAWGQPGPANGVARGASVVILGYAILKHQLLGIDVRVRWAIKRSTLAAIFVVVFFVVTEAAQVYFDERGPYFGIAAAGALLFALAPLQRVAERVATAAVPLVDDERSANVYRHALRAAMRDGSLSRDEERHLAALADELGLPAREALRLREEVEAERAA